MKTTSKNDRKILSASDVVLRRLVKAPETAHQIYELAESLYLRDGGDSARMTLAAIERVDEYLRAVENDGKRMKNQFLELATAPGSFHPKEIPIGF